MLEPIAQASDLIIDTSRMGVHELRELVRRRVNRARARPDLDPVRVLRLQERDSRRRGLRVRRPLAAESVLGAGASQPVPVAMPRWRSSWSAATAVPRLIADITRFVEARIPEYQVSNRRYFTVAIGCTGGQHRSVYLVEKIAADFASRFPDVSLQAFRPGSGTRFRLSPAQALQQEYERAVQRRALARGPGAGDRAGATWPAGRLPARPPEAPVACVAGSRRAGRQRFALRSCRGVYLWGERGARQDLAGGPVLLAAATFRMSSDCTSST